MLLACLRKAIMPRPTHPVAMKGSHLAIERQGFGILTETAGRTKLLLSLLFRSILETIACGLLIFAS